MTRRASLRNICRFLTTLTAWHLSRKCSRRIVEGRSEVYRCGKAVVVYIKLIEVVCVNDGAKSCR